MQSQFQSPFQMMVTKQNHTTKQQKKKQNKNVPLTSSVTATNSPPNSTTGPDPTYYRMHCASWTVLNDLMEMTR